MTQNEGEARVSLRPLGPDDQDEFIAQARASAGLHHPWYSTPTTPEDFQTYLARLSQPVTEGFLVCLRDGGAMVGIITGSRPAGFRKEGYSPAMLFIDGDWRDHERWAITREMTDFPPVAPHPTRPAR